MTLDIARFLRDGWASRSFCALSYSYTLSIYTLSIFYFIHWCVRVIQVSLVSIASSFRDSATYNSWLVPYLRGSVRRLYIHHHRSRAVFLRACYYSNPVGERSTAISLSVCVSVCPRVYLWNRWTDLHEMFRANSLWPWLGPPLAALRYVMYFRFYGWRHVWP